MAEVERVTGIPDVLLLRPEVHEDRRGFFLEIFRQDALDIGFVQGNHSHSREGVLRGLHFHARQADAWYVVSGRARVGLADLRQRSGRPTVATVDLSSEEPGVIYIPPGVAHGFLALTALDLVYWVTHYFDGTDEHGVPWNDPALEVPWGVEDPIVSDRDAAAEPLDWQRIEEILRTARSAG